MKLLLIGLTLTIWVQAETHLIFPWVTNTELFRSRLVINNLSGNPAEITLQAFRSSGESETAILEMDPMQQGVFPASDLFQELGEGRGFTVYLTSDSDRIRGQLVVLGTGSPSGASPAQADVVELSQASPRLIFNYLTVGPSQDPSAPVLINPNDDPVSVSLQAYQGSQLAAEATRTIGPSLPLAETTSDIFPQLDGSVFLIATSDQPLLGVAFLFNQNREPALANAAELDFVPGDDVQPQAYVDTLVDTGVAVDGIIIDSNGNLVGAGGWRTNHLMQITPSGEISILARGFNGPVHGVQAENGLYYVSSFNDGSIKTVDSEGNLATFAQGLDAPVGMAFDGSGNLIVCEYGLNSPGHRLAAITPDGQISEFTNDPLLHTPIDILANADGSFYVANQLTGHLRPTAWRCP